MIRFLKNAQSLVSESTGVTDTSTSVDLESISNYCIISTVTDLDPSADTFVDGDVTIAADTITLTAHAFLTGLKVALTTAGVLPTGLSATDYYVIKVDANTVSLATTAANAIAGTVVVITAAAGGGTHTLTPASASVAMKLQCSVDDVTFVDIASSSQDVSAGGSFVWDASSFGYKHVRVITTVTAGQVTLATLYSLKGEVD